ncbi:DUF1778 domain-containing protein [Thiocystis violascens]|uniref:DUF1778 domain-containing protein n=1 Tax=Thiocystis violascens (strain ATCC 17096 / DSM 198 / 6111) TaxID=765911 RepID=I3YAM3_THIV6|nr:DUF1778 domain-containing protein [Thiocystis violascens]AFL74041.1 hypothetical protein Thivi_2088 [Thiocystis violascens DSM 198]
MPTPSPRTAKLDLRLSPEVKARLVAAADQRHQSVSEFVLSSALERADETLASRQRFILDAERWSAFLAALDAPPRSLPRLDCLFREPTHFDPSASA